MMRFFDNPCLAWNSTDRAMHRGVCFKGDKNTIPETSAERTNAQIAAEQFNLYKNTYRPFEHKFIADVVQPAAPKQAVVAGQVNADIAQKTARPIGVDPNRLLRSPGAADAVAATRATATNNATQAVDDKRVAGLQAVVDMGMGKSGKAQLGTGDVAENAVGAAVKNEASDVQLHNAITGGVMSGLGAAGAAYKNMNTPAVQYQYEGGDAYMPALAGGRS